MTIIAAFPLTLLFSISSTVMAQIPYNFSDTDNNRDIQAYWYNAQLDSIIEDRAGDTFFFGPSMQVYCKIPADTFLLSVEVCLRNNKKIFEHAFRIENDSLLFPVGKEMTGCKLDIHNGFLRLAYPVSRSTENPQRITVKLAWGSGRRQKDIECRYHKLHGWITDFQGKPFRAGVRISPDFFGHQTGLWSDSLGYYEIELPEQTYNSIYVDDGTYQMTTLEAWGWHIIMDCDQRLDFKVGTGEVYGLHAWPNNGGFRSFQLAFRPMILIPDGETKTNRETSVTLNDNEIKVLDIAPDLHREDIKVRVNGKDAQIFSLQKYYETGKDNAMPSYIIQVSKDVFIGKVTFEVEYRTEVEISGRKVQRCSMGYYQTYLKYGGMSDQF